MALSGAAEAKKVAPAVPLREKRLVLIRREDGSEAMERLYHAFGSMVGAAIFGIPLDLGGICGEKEGRGVLSREDKKRKKERKERRTAAVWTRYLSLHRFRHASASQSMHLHTYRWLQIAVQ